MGGGVVVVVFVLYFRLSSMSLIRNMSLKDVLFVVVRLKTIGSKLNLEMILS